MTPELLCEYILAASAGIAGGIFVIGCALGIMGALFGSKTHSGANDVEPGQEELS